VERCDVCIVGCDSEAATKPIQPGSWLVNCTGYFDGGDHPYEPYMSEGGSVVSVQVRSATLHLTSFAAYFLTQLLFLSKIKDVPLYDLDMPVLRGTSNAAFPYTIFTLAQHNLSLIYEAVPAKVFLDCGLDLDRWYPLPRRTAGTARFILTHRREHPHRRRTLDTVRGRFGVRCGPLPPERSRRMTIRGRAGARRTSNANER
jgi:hypothetical protein